MPDIDRILDLVGRLLENMDNMFSVIFMLMVLFTFIDGSIRKKNKSPSLPPSLDDDFNVLPLDDKPAIEVSREVKTAPPTKTPRGTSIPKPSTAEEKPPVFSAEEAREAMILKEIFDRPKSMRRR